MTDQSVRETVTRSKFTIHNPDDARHFMRIKPVAGTVRIRHGDRVIAESTRAVRLIEAGNDLYDPCIYMPREDVTADLAPAAKERTWCPLKGHAEYFDLKGPDGGVAEGEIAWSYTDTLDFAAELRDLISFYGNKVAVEEIPAPAEAA